MVHKYPSGKQVFYISLLEVKLFSLKGKFFFLGEKQKKPPFHKNPKEKYKPQNQTMTDDSDDTHPNLFLFFRLIKEKAHSKE